MSFQKEKKYKANKDHVCDICNGTIKKGTGYIRKTVNADGDGFCEFKECMGCQKVISEYCNSKEYDQCEGYSSEYIQEWWMDVKCNNCKYKYLPCEQVEGAGCPTGDCEKCDYYTRYGTCRGGDTCSEMTRYSWCEKYEKADL